MPPEKYRREGTLFDKRPFSFNENNQGSVLNNLDQMVCDKKIMFFNLQAVIEWAKNGFLSYQGHLEDIKIKPF